MDTERPPFSLILLTFIWLAGLSTSWLIAKDRITWFMEIVPALIALPLLWSTHSRFRFTAIVYTLIAIHGLILMLGGAYTYAHVPLGAWVQEWFHLSRNPYDKLGHFAQGFVPAMVARELLIRKFGIPAGKLNAYLVISICLAISAFYELIEWWAALAMGQGADEFLGTQGDPWDTQSDMLMALIGSVCALLLLSRRHDQSMGESVNAVLVRSNQ